MGLTGRVCVLAVFLLAAFVPALSFPGQAAKLPPGNPQIVQVSSSNAHFNDAFQLYESFLDQYVRFDLTVGTDWDSNLITNVRFIATMAPAFGKRMDIRYPNNTVDPRLAGPKYLADSEYVSNSYGVDIPYLSSVDLAGKDTLSVTFHFRTAGTWRIYCLYEVPGVGYCGGDGELAVIRVAGNPDGVGSASTGITFLLGIPVLVQFLIYGIKRLSRKKERPEN